VDVGVEGGEGRVGAVDFGGPDAGGRVEDLALEVGELDDVVVDDGEGADPRGREVEGRGGAEAPGPDDEHAGGAELGLARGAHRRESEVAGVAGGRFGAAVRGRTVSAARGGVSGERALDGEAEAAPAVEPGREARDVFVAELAELHADEGGAPRPGAEDDDGVGLVREEALDLVLDAGVGEVQSAREGALGDLEVLADVEEGRDIGEGRRIEGCGRGPRRGVRALGDPEPRGEGLRRDRGDLRHRPRQLFGEGRHEIARKHSSRHAASTSPEVA
jgi:hypothetical protein